MGQRLLKAIRTITDKTHFYTQLTHTITGIIRMEILFFHRGRRDCRRTRNDKRLYGESVTPARGVPPFSWFLRLGMRPFLPQETFEHEIELDLGNQPLHLVPLGKGGKQMMRTAIRIPAEACIVSGDTVMTGSFPIFGQPVMNEGLMANHDWVDTIRELRTYAPAHVLPGTWDP